MIVNNPAEGRSVTPRWVVWRDGFTGAELADIEAYCDRAGVEPAGMLSGSDESRGRRSGVRFHKPDGANAWFFRKLNIIVDALNARSFDFDLDGYAYFQYTVYSGEAGGFYDWHMDDPRRWIPGVRRGHPQALAQPAAVRARRGFHGRRVPGQRRAAGHPAHRAAREGRGPGVPILDDPQGGAGHMGNAEVDRSVGAGDQVQVKVFR
jgi:hypothetical protein